ncbi:MAG: hypothetical protein ACR2FF_01115 [Mycobacteriales bacterium]
MRLPDGAAFSLVVRRSESFVPGGETRLARGDQLLIVVTRRAREATERRLRAVSIGGRLARWQLPTPERGAGRRSQPTNRRPGRPDPG